MNLCDKNGCILRCILDRNAFWELRNVMDMLELRIAMDIGIFHLYICNRMIVLKKKRLFFSKLEFSHHDRYNEIIVPTTYTME